MKNQGPQLFFLGAGHGGIAALKSLQSSFNSIEIHSNDTKLLDFARKTDVIIPNINSITNRFGVMAGFTKILDKAFLRGRTILNVHYSLLPHLRGMHSIVWAILNGDEAIGWSIHMTLETIDSGPIYFQKSYKYTGETSQELMKIFDSDVKNNLGEVVSKVISKELTPIPQENKLATWVPKRNLNDCLINFNSTASELERFFRALVEPYPLPAFIYKSNRYEVIQHEIISRDYFCTVARVINIENNMVYIKIKDGILVIKKIRNPDGVSLDPSKILPLGARIHE